MTRQDIEQRAFALHDGGFHCAEAVLLAVTEACGGLPQGMSPRMATCFGGGVGRTHADMCGALAGGLLALGCLRGRDVQGGNWDAAAALATRYRQGFVERFGSSVCKDVLAGLGHQVNMDKCKQLSGFTAGLAFALLGEGRVGREGEEVCACAALAHNHR